MKKNIEKNNLPLHVSLLSSKIKVIIIGGGTAAYIKSKAFIMKGCQVCVLSKKFIDSFDNIKKYLNVSLIKEEYNIRYILDKHIVVIATDDNKVNSTIRQHCRQFCKIYVDAVDFKEGNCILPCNRSTENMSIAVNIRGISPITSVFIADKLINYIKKYDDFVEFSSNMRNSISKIEYRKNIMNFISTDDFYFFYKKGKAPIVIEMFYNK